MSLDLESLDLELETEKLESRWVCRFRVIHRRTAEISTEFLEAF